MTSLTIRMLASAAILSGLVACGRSLDTPTNLVVRSYPANKDFRLAVIMTACSDTCATYEAGSCTATVKDQLIQLSVNVGYSDKEGTDPAKQQGCNLSCGPEVVVFCDLPSLPAGTYTVQSGRFQSSIELR